jgi:hypothetical protein
MQNFLFLLYIIFSDITHFDFEYLILFSENEVLCEQRVFFVK